MRVLAKHYRADPRAGGPSWLTFLGHKEDSLGIEDMFRCDSQNPQPQGGQNRFVLWRSGWAPHPEREAGDGFPGVVYSDAFCLDQIVAWLEHRGV